MKKSGSEKLLDAIGQIDDELIEAAAKVREETGGTDWATAGKKRHRAKAGGFLTGRKAVLRWQGALAACAALAVCIGLTGLLNRSSALPGPYFGGKGSKDESAVGVDTGGMDMAPRAQEAALADEAGAGAVPAAISEEAGGMPVTLSEETGEMPAALSEEAGEVPAALSEEVEEALDGDGPVEEMQKEISLPDASAVILTAEGQQEQMEQMVSVSEVSRSESRIVLVLSNRSETGTLEYGHAFRIEVMENGTWQEVPMKPDTGFKESLFLVEPGGSGEITSDIEAVYGVLPAGQYRLVKDCCMTEETDDGQKRLDGSICVEFEVP